jgi:hypothetical protein
MIAGDFGLDRCYSVGIEREHLSINHRQSSRTAGLIEARRQPGKGVLLRVG